MKNIEESSAWRVLTNESHPSTVENGLILEDVGFYEVTLHMMIYPIRQDFNSTPLRINHMDVEYNTGDLFKIWILVQDDFSIIPHKGGRKWWERSMMVTKDVLRKYFELAYNGKSDELNRIRKILKHDDLVLMWVLANKMMVTLPWGYYKAFYNHPSRWQLEEFGIA